MIGPEGLLVDSKRLDELARDLRRIRAGEGPSAADLEKAPILDGWMLASRPACALYGHVAGHPLLAARKVVTSELFALDRRHLMWARTYSRWYRLGRRIDDRPDA